MATYKLDCGCVKERDREALVTLCVAHEKFWKECHEAALSVRQLQRDLELEQEAA